MLEKCIAFLSHTTPAIRVARESGFPEILIYAQKGQPKGISVVITSAYNLSASNLSLILNRNALFGTVCLCGDAHLGSPGRVLLPYVKPFCKENSEQHSCALPNFIPNVPF